MTDESVFEPEAVTIPTGDTVWWRKVGDIEHTCYGRKRIGGWIGRPWG